MLITNLNGMLQLTGNVTGLAVYVRAEHVSAVYKKDVTIVMLTNGIELPVREAPEDVYRTVANALRPAEKK